MISSTPWVRASVGVFVCLALLGPQGVASAQSYTNKVAGNWSAAGSWTTGVPPAGGGADIAVVFNNSATDASVNDLAGPFVLNSLSFAAANAVTLSGNGLVFTNSGAALPQVSLDVNKAMSIAAPSTLATDTLFYVNQSVLTHSGPLSGSGALTKSGAGTLVLSGSNTFSGATVVTAGSLQLGGGGSSGSIEGPLTLQPGASNVGLVYARTDQASPVGGVISNALAGSGVVNLSVNSGTLVLGEANFPTASTNAFGSLSIANGAGLALRGAVASTNTFASMTTWQNNIRLTVQGGVNTIGANAWTGVAAAIYARGGVLNINSVIVPYYNAGNYGYLLAAGGTLNLGAGATLARNGTAVLNIREGGAVTFASGGGGVGFNMGGATSVVYQTGGSFGGTGLFYIGNSGRSELTLAGGTLAVTNKDFQPCAGTSVVNLNGGVLLANRLIDWGIPKASFLSLNGGTLKAFASRTDFIKAGTFSNAWVYAGNALLDDGGYAVTVGQALQAPGGLGVASLPWGGTLGGYIGAPHVVLSGGSGSGATAVALYDPASGTVTGAVVTCAGAGYLADDTVAVRLSGGGVADVALGTATLGENVSGGLVKLGAGTLTLAGTNTYSGATVVSNGTLYVLSTNLLASTDWRIAAGATNKFGSGVSLAGKSLTVDVGGDTAGVLSVTGDLSLGGKLTVANLSGPRKIAQCTGAVTGRFGSVSPGYVVAYVVNGTEVWVKKSYGTLLRVF